MLVFNVFDDRVPAVGRQARSLDEVVSYSPSIIVDLVAVTWCVDDIKP